MARRDQELQAATTAPQSSPLDASPLMQAGSGHDCRPVLKLEIAPDDLAEHKRRLLQKNGVCAVHGLPLQRAVEVLIAGRIITLSKVDASCLQVCVSPQRTAIQPIYGTM